LNFGVNHIESEHKLISNRKLENTGFAITKTKSVGCRKLELKQIANYSYKTVQAVLYTPLPVTKVKSVL